VQRSGIPQFLFHILAPGLLRYCRISSLEESACPAPRPRQTRVPLFPDNLNHSVLAVVFISLCCAGSCEKTPDAQNMPGVTVENCVICGHYELFCPEIKENDLFS
jgi:hypothetical protein